MKNNNFFIKILILVCTLIGIGGYSYFESRNIVNGPMISISEPQNGAVIKVPLVEIKGKTKNISSISLNDRQITVDDKGEFKEKLLLSSGYNIIKLKVQDRFGREKNTLLELMLKDEAEGLAQKNNSIN
jgi:hypothetical protein